MKPLIVANWKLNPTSQKEAKFLFNSVKNGIKNIKNVEVVICPPFVFLFHLQPTTHNLRLGAQDCFWEEKGPFTGEISSLMLKDFNCRYVILGHSERRRYFGETDEMINKKIKAVLSAKLNPIFCIGETKTERKKGQTKEILKSQIQKGLKGIPRRKIKNLVIAYEPVWAIGTGNPCDVEEAQKMGLLIRKIMAKKYSLSIAKAIKILYGGSVNSKNAKPYITEANFQGLLVGGASLDPKEFVKIVKTVSCPCG
jgi:triosephosphate isomerase